MADGWRVEDLIGKAEIALSCCSRADPSRCLYRDLLNEADPGSPS